MAETFATFLALEWFFSAMKSLVFSKMMLVFKSLRAYVTRKWPLTWQREMMYILYKYINLLICMMTRNMDSNRYKIILKIKLSLRQQDVILTLNVM